MKTPPASHFLHTLLSLALVFAAALALTPWSSSAADPDAPPNPIVRPNPIRDIVGLWQGTFQSAVNPAIQGDVFLDITVQRHRRFGGSISFGTFQPVDPCKGTIAAINRIHFVSESGGGRIAAHGQLVGDTMLLEYRAVFSDGTVDHGAMTLSGHFDDSDNPTIDSL